MIEYIVYSFIWWTFISSVVISAGYHRYFSHRSFEVGVWYEYLVLLLGPLSGSGSLLGWVGVHRMHHNHSDTELDPHSPKHQPVWKVLTSTFKVPAIRPRHVKDLLRNKRVMWFHQYHKEIRLLTFAFGMFLPFEWFMILIVLPMIYGYVGFGLLNTLCHRHENVSNSWIANILTGGEGWHANHHEEPRSWRIGKKWYQWDPAALFILLVKKNK